MKRSRRILVAMLIAALIVGVSSVAIAAMPEARSISAENKALTFVNDDLSNVINDNGQAKLIREDSVYENMLKTDLISTKTDDYLYLFAKDSGELKTIMLIGDEIGNTVQLSSENAAINAAKTVVETALPNVGLENFDVKCRTSEQRYSIEFWEKLSSDIYGGRKISVIFDKNGTLETLVSVSNTAGAWRTNAEKAISREKAIELAYEAINSWNNCSASSASNEAISDAKIKTGTDIIVSDSGAINADDKAAAINNNRVSIEKKDSHDITTYKEAHADGINWQVDIANVDRGNGYTVTYFVTINAMTGDVIMVNMTR